MVIPSLSLWPSVRLPSVVSGPLPTIPDMRFSASSFQLNSCLRLRKVFRLWRKMLQTISFSSFEKESFTHTSPPMLQTGISLIGSADAKPRVRWGKGEVAPIARLDGDQTDYKLRNSVSLTPSGTVCLPARELLAHRNPPPRPQGSFREAS